MDKEKIKKIAILSSIIATIFLVLWGVSYMSFWLKNTAYLNSAKSIVENFPQCKDYKSLKINKKPLSKSKNLNFCNIIFEGKIGKQDCYIVFLTLTGKYGSYQGLFLTSTDDVVFCGLAGNIRQEKTTEYYGINKAQISLKIEELRNISIKNR